MISRVLQTSVKHRPPTHATREADGQVAYHAAGDLEDVDRSLQLVYQAYRQRGLIAPNPAAVRVTPFHLLPSTQILVAKAVDEVLCTATLICDTQELGLPLEAMYADEVAQRRRCGLRLAEASCLADRTGAKTPLKVVIRLMALTIQCAKYRGVDQLLAAVHPHHADFYTGFLGFEAFGEVKLCSAVLDNPAVALALDLNRLQEKHPRAYQRAFEPPFAEVVLREQPLPREIRSYLAFLLEQTSQPPRDSEESAPRHESRGIARPAALTV